MRMGRFDFRAVSATLAPIALIVACTMGGSFLLERRGTDTKTANLLAMVCGIAIALPIVFGANSSAVKKSLIMFRNSKLYSVLLIVVGVLAFSEALRMPLDTDGATLVQLMRDEFFAMGVPIVLVIMLLPAIAGFVTGIAVAFTGASFPLIFALLGPEPSLNKVVSTALFAFSFGYMGMMISPVHICFLVTNEYFKSRLLKAYPYLAGPVVSILVSAIVMSSLYYLLLK
jgi:hypothetical protein